MAAGRDRIKYSGDAPANDPAWRVVIALRPSRLASGWVMAVLAAGLVHGLAHGGEIGGAAGVTAIGMLAGSALLHGFGVALGVASARYAGALRFGGAATAALGVVLFLA